MHSPDLTERNIDKIAELFPTVITEGRDDDDNPTRAIDFDLLRQELSAHVIDGPQERYQLDWPGKREALFAANAPIAKTLRPVREESVDFDTTQNIFIEGDNLEALKLLQESYLGKVKLIYIDPPYNTGNDFVYDDDFAENTAEYLAKSGQVDAVGNRLVVNTETNGRFHSDWLSMMYPRLKLARNLLTDDGAILISIDDGETASLRHIADEVFGARNFVGTLIWKSRQIVDSRNASNLSGDHEYVHVYARDYNRFSMLGQEIDAKKYSNPDGDERGPWMSNNILGLADASRRPNLHYSIVDPATGRSFSPSPESGWRYGRETMATKIAENRIVFPKSDEGRPREKIYLHELKSRKTGFTSVLDSTNSYTLHGTREVRELMGGKVFDFPKPVSLVSRLVEQIATDPDDIVMDFFAGSGTTAEAVIRLNARDGGRRRFMLVQLPEPVSGTDVQGLPFTTLSGLSRERVKRAGQRVLEEYPGSTLDVGFRSLRLDTSNLADVLRAPDALGQDELDLYMDSVKPDRTGEDLLFQVLLDWGLELTMSIAVENLDGREVFVVEDGTLIACFDADVSLALVREIASREPLRAVFRDAGFATDADRINAEQLFAEVSPATDVKAI